MARRLKFSLEIETTGAVRAVKQVETATEGAATSIQDVGKVAGVAGVQIKAAMAVAAAGIAAVTAAAIAAAAAVAKVTSEVIDLAAEADEIAKTAKALGTTAEEVQLLQGAFELGGVSASKATNAVRKLSVNLGEAARGTGAATLAMEELGLSVDQLERVPLVERFALIADALGEVESQSLKARIAQDLLGRAGVELLAAFEGGGESIRLAAEQIEEAGIISNQTAAEGEVLTDAVTLMQRSFDALRVEALQPLIPVVAAIANVLAEVAQFIRQNVDFEDVADAIERNLVDRAIPAITGFGAIVIASFAEIRQRAMQLKGVFQLVAAAATRDLSLVADGLRTISEAEVDRAAVATSILEWASAMATAQDTVRGTLQAFEELETATRDFQPLTPTAIVAPEAEGAAEAPFAPSESFTRSVFRNLGLRDLTLGDDLVEQAEQQAEAVAGIFDAVSEQIGFSFVDTFSRISAQTAQILGQLGALEEQQLQRSVRAHREARNEIARIQEELTSAVTESSRRRLRAELSDAREREQAAKQQALAAWRRGQALAITQAIIGTASAVINGLNSQPFLPVGIAMGALAGALGGVQIAAIAGQEPPQFHSGGLLRDEMLIRARAGEAVLSPTAVQAAGGEQGVRALNSGQGLGPTTLIVQQKVRTRVLDSQAYDLGRTSQGALQGQIQYGRAKPGAHRPQGMG